MINLFEKRMIVLVAIMLSFSSILIAEEKQSGTVYQQIEQILSSSQIFSLEKQLELSYLLDEFNEKDYSLEELEELMLKFDRKIDRDRTALRDILVNVEKLMDIKYAKNIDRVSQGKIRDMWSFYRRLDDEFREVKSKARFQRVMSKDRNFYKNRILKYSYFLTGEKIEYAVVDFWDMIHRSVGEPYRKWVDRKKLLDDKQERYSGEFAGYDKRITFEEASFLRVFKKIQVLVRRLADSEEDFMDM